MRQESDKDSGGLSIRWQVFVCGAVWLAAGWLQPIAAHGAYDDLVKELKEELAIYPNDALVRYRLAEAHAGHEEWRACLQEIKLIERIAPGVHPTGYLKGLALHTAGKQEEAKQALDEFLATHPHHVDGLATRGKVFMSLHDPVAAAADFREGIRHATTPSIDLYTEAAQALKAADQASAASRVLDDGIKALGEVPALLTCALEIECASGSWDAALGRVGAMQKVAPKPEPWMVRRAEILDLAGRKTESRAAWTAVRDHLLVLPNLEHGTPQNSLFLQQARQALGETVSAPVAAAPSSNK